ncbi:hypothetical protein ZIOFF_045311 [Zingiber officinale]|uniref:DUF4216 domain-containing protein n=1 Tax=Zingiber officinale TaxID=94328 RepID=A0A8J5KY53_ZINOF|nr:hypothetical protein ZIOFF_045311 [Zingiber officinale]
MTNVLADLTRPVEIGESSEPIQQEGFQIENFDNMLKEIEKELYPGCVNFSTLNFLVKLMHVKVLNKWSNKSFDMLLKLMKQAFPQAILPNSHYEAKRKLHEMGLGYESIHVYEHDCALFWKENVGFENCPIYGSSRWVDKNTKGKKVPKSVYSYSGAIINGVKFLVEQRDVRRTTQNSGILVPGVGGQNYYAVLQDVIELCYLKDCIVLIFKCKWFDTDPRRRRIQEDNRFTSIYTGIEWYKNDPFILVSQAKSVYYMNDIKNDPIWKLLQAYAPYNVWDYPNIEVENDVDRTTTNAHVVQELNSQPLQLVVELPELENVSFYHDDIGPIEVINIDQLQQNIGDFVVDGDDFQDDTLEEYDEEDDVTVEIDDDDSIDIETNGTTSEEMSSLDGSSSGANEGGSGGDGREHTGGSLGENGKWFNNLITQIVRDTISLRIMGWEDAFLAEKQLIFDRLDNKFEYEKTNLVMAEVE